MVSQRFVMRDFVAVQESFYSHAFLAGWLHLNEFESSVFPAAGEELAMFEMEHTGWDA